MKENITNNTSLKNILFIYEFLTETIRHNLSLKLMDTNKEHPLMLNLSDLDIVSIFQESEEGTIWINRKDGEEVNIDKIIVEELIAIIGYIEKKV